MWLSRGLQLHIIHAVNFYDIEPNKTVRNFNIISYVQWYIAEICKLKKSKEYICIWCVSIVVGFHLKSCKDVMIWLAIHIFRLILWGTCAVCNTWKVTHFLLLAITLMILMRFLLIVDYHWFKVQNFFIAFLSHVVCIICKKIEILMQQIFYCKSLLVSTKLLFRADGENSFSPLILSD